MLDNIDVLQRVVLRGEVEQAEFGTETLRKFNDIPRYLLTSQAPIGAPALPQLPTDPEESLEIESDHVLSSM